MHQLHHKRILPDIEFFDEKGTPVSYHIQHEDNPNDTCNDFYPIRYKRSDEKKYYDYKITVKTLPSGAHLTNSLLTQSNRLQTVSEWDDSSTSLEEYVDQRPNQIHPSTRLILRIVPLTPLARPKITPQTR